MISEIESHKIILARLFELYESSSPDSEALDAVISITWELGVKMNFDYGYHELSELAQGKKAGSEEGKEHYLKVINSFLREK